MRAVRSRIVQATMIPMAPEALADVREPEPAAAIEDDVVRTAEPVAIARLIESVEAAGREIDALDAPRGVVRGCAQRQEHAVRFAQVQPAVVADVDSAVRSNRRAVRAAAKGGDHFGMSVPHARQRAA